MKDIQIVRRKLKKLIKDPLLFFYDMLGKKLRKKGIGKSIVRTEILHKAIDGGVLKKIVNNLNKDEIFIFDEFDNAVYTAHKRHYEHYSVFFKKHGNVDLNRFYVIKKEGCYIIHGQLFKIIDLLLVYLALNNKLKICYGEDGFLHSIGRPVDFTLERNYRIGCSLTLDFNSAHFDCNNISWLERRLNSDVRYTDAEMSRARKCIEYIKSNYISKYNNQPIYEPEYGRPGKKKVLVIDQAVNDLSISLGGCDESTFIRMLKDAVRENKECDILVKVHPDMVANPNRGGVKNKKLGHFSDIDIQSYGENIYIIADYLNPIALLNYVDKVYVATSQMGFEAMLCEKDVYIYGIPFYAGWGQGKCRSQLDALKRRIKIRTLEEIFYAAYIEYSRYINPELGRRCEIEECLQFLKVTRDRYFKENDIRHDLITLCEDKEDVTNPVVIDIAFCFDGNYYKQAAVAILSLLKSNEDYTVKYSVHCVVENDVTDENCAEIRRCVENFESLYLLEFIRNKYSFEKAYECRGITKAAYTRLILHRLLPDLDKLIYSDIDVVFNKSLRELYDTELGDYMMAACIDPLMNRQDRWDLRLEKYKYWKDYLYNAKFNYYSSGLLLLNLKELRNKNFESMIKDIVEINLEYQDMDIINIAINNKIKPLSNKYCVLTGLIKDGYEKTFKLGIIPSRYFKDVYDDPVIFHFAGKKPWDDRTVIGSALWWSVVQDNNDLLTYFNHRYDLTYILNKN